LYLFGPNVCTEYAQCLGSLTVMISSGKDSFKHYADAVFKMF